MAKPKQSQVDRLQVLAKNMLYERREGRKEMYALAMKVFAEVDADCVSCGGGGYESFRVEVARRLWA